MTARDTIAAALFWDDFGEGWAEETDDGKETYRLQADAVIAAVRAMPVEDVAELIGGKVEHDTLYSPVIDPHTPAVRPVGPWAPR
jgi:hypothetical protein